MSACSAQIRALIRVKPSFAAPSTARRSSRTKAITPRE
jgi:hypothetical protein